MSEDLQVGSKLSGRYVLERLIASGPVAKVFEAKDLQRQQQVALKIVPPPPHDDDPLARVERFRLEAQALARLTHPNIVRVLDVGATDDRVPYVVMPLIPGGALAAKIEDAQLEVRSAIQIGIRIASALQYAHEQGIVHRNVSAESILLDEDEDGAVLPILVGFGLAKHQEAKSLTVQSVVLGAVETMAPEQVQGKEVDARTDIYALGIVLYRLLTGRYPFRAKERIDILAMHLGKPPNPFGKVARDLSVPGGLEAIVMRCLEKKPEDRYADVKSLVEELEDKLSIEPAHYINPRGDSPSVVAADAAAGRSPSMLWGMAAVLGILVISAVVVLALT